MNVFQVAWLTDIHLNFLEPEPLEFFLKMLEKKSWDALVITGDISESVDFGDYLKLLQIRFHRPIYFVLGNHDYYYSSFAKVWASAYRLHMENSLLHWLPCSGIVPLTDDTALIGHDGWFDARYGDFEHSKIVMNDYLLIKELADCFDETETKALQDKLHELGDNVAKYFHNILPKALQQYEHVILATHVPPFPEACIFDEEIDRQDWLPHYSCKVVGDVLKEIMEQYPYNKLTVLCGHTHSAQQVNISSNIQVFTGGSEYCSPEIQKIFEIESCQLNYA